MHVAVQCYNYRVHYQIGKNNPLRISVNMRRVAVRTIRVTRAFTNIRAKWNYKFHVPLHLKYWQMRQRKKGR